MASCSTLNYKNEIYKDNDNLICLLIAKIGDLTGKPCLLITKIGDLLGKSCLLITKIGDLLGKSCLLITKIGDLLGKSCLLITKIGVLLGWLIWLVYGVLCHFQHISVILWQSVLLVEETSVRGENH